METSTIVSTVALLFRATYINSILVVDGILSRHALRSLPRVTHGKPLECIHDLVLICGGVHRLPWVNSLTHAIPGLPKTRLALSAHPHIRLPSVYGALCRRIREAWACWRRAIIKPHFPPIALSKWKSGHRRQRQNNRIVDISGWSRDVCRHHRCTEGVRWRVVGTVAQ